MLQLQKGESMRGKTISLILTCLCPILLAVTGDKPLTNEDVVALVKAELGDAVVVAKIRQAPAADFDLSTETLIKLKKQGVSQEVIAAMLARAPGASSGKDLNTSSAPVRVATTTETLDLAKMQGTVNNSLLSLGTTTYHNFPGARAKTRVHDQAPTILIASPNQPNGQYFVVKTNPNAKKQLRSVKVGHGFYGMSDQNTPDPDWTIPYEATESPKGIWRLKLSKPLGPGEYGVYVANSNLLGAGELYDFGVD